MSPIPISIRPHRHAPSRQQKPDGVLGEERSAPILHDAPIAAAMDLELFIPRLDRLFPGVLGTFPRAIPPHDLGQAVARVRQLRRLALGLHAITRVLEVVFRESTPAVIPGESAQDSREPGFPG